MLLVLFICGLVTGSLACSYDHCIDEQLGNELMYARFLPNETHLESLCPKAIFFMECLKEYFECYGGETLEEFALSSNKSLAGPAIAILDAMDFVRDICDKDSSLHHDYLASDDCFRSYIVTALRSCEEDIASAIEAFFDKIYPDLEEKTDEINAEIKCLTEAFEYRCIVDILGESCGEVAHQTAMDFVKKFRAFFKSQSCFDAERADDLEAQLLDFLQLEDNERKEIEEVTDSLKRRR